VIDERNEGGKKMKGTRGCDQQQVLKVKWGGEMEKKKIEADETQ